MLCQFADSQASEWLSKPTISLGQLTTPGRLSCQCEFLAPCCYYSLAPLGLSTMISVVAGRDDLLTSSVPLSSHRVASPRTKDSTRVRLPR